MEAEETKADDPGRRTAAISKVAFGMFMLTVAFVGFCKTFQIYPPKHIFKYIFLLPPIAFFLSIGALFIKNTNRLLPVITILVVAVLGAPSVIHLVKTWRNNPIIPQKMSPAGQPSAGKADYKPLHRAIRDGNLEEIRKILDSGGDPNARDSLNQTALEKAIETGNVQTVKLLLDKGAEVDARIGHFGGGTALMVAALHGHVDIAEILVEQGAAIERKNDLGMSPAFFAAASGELPMLTWLHKNGANLNVTNAEGRPIIHRAGSAEVLEYLIDNGVDIHSRDRNGNTILHFHVTASVVRKAIELGADLDAKNNDGKTPMETASLDSVKKALREGRANLSAQN